MNLELGMPVTLVDSKGLEEYGFTDGMKGMVNSVTSVDGVEYVFFMPSNKMKNFVITGDRLEIDEEALAKMKQEA